MELYRVKIPLDNIDVVTGTTVLNGVNVSSGYVNLTKTGDTFVNLFLTSDYDDFGIYTDFDERAIEHMVTKIPSLVVPGAASCVPCDDVYQRPSALPPDTLYITQGGEIFYNSSQEIGGFQFEIEFCPPHRGSIKDYQAMFDGAEAFTISRNGSLILGFSLVGGTITKGSGILFETKLIGIPSKLSNIVISNAAGVEIPFNYVTDVQDVVCDPCCTETVAVVDTSSIFTSCEGEMINIIMDPAPLNVLTIDVGGQYETTFTPTGGTMCLPIGCYEVTFSRFGPGAYYIYNEQGDEIVTDGISLFSDETPEEEEVGHLYEGQICIECKSGKLAIATHQSDNYTGATAYVMAIDRCNSWTVTGLTSNNLLEVLPIAGLTGLTTNNLSNAAFDANDNPIVITSTYGVHPQATGATYNIGTGTTLISYDTRSLTTPYSSFSFERECCEDCYGLNTKEEMKMGWVFDPKINVNVFIDRGQNSVFDKLLRISEVIDNDELLDYNNNFFNVDKQQIQ